jgi:hypothetical protein
MRFVSVTDYDDVVVERDYVVDALARPDTVVLHFETGFQVYEGGGLVTVGTTPAGVLLLLETNGAMHIVNCQTDRLLSEKVPLDRFLDGPSDVLEFRAVWNEWRQRQAMTDTVTPSTVQANGEACGGRGCGCSA